MELHSRFGRKRAWVLEWSWTPRGASADNLLHLSSAVDRSEVPTYVQRAVDGASSGWLNVWTVRLRSRGRVRLFAASLVVEVLAPVTVWEQWPGFLWRAMHFRTLLGTLLALVIYRRDSLAFFSPEDPVSSAIFFCNWALQPELWH